MIHPFDRRPHAVALGLGYEIILFLSVLMFGTLTVLVLA